jgi:predicted nucleotide-binding protein
MKKTKTYEYVRFSPEVLTAASEELWKHLPQGKQNDPIEGMLSVEVNDVKWHHRSEEEFFADYRRLSGNTAYSRKRANLELQVLVLPPFTDVSVEASSRQVIEAVFEVFERNLETSRITEPPKPPPPRPRIFVGHGRSSAWRDLKDHLHEKHGYDVEAYEIGARAGHAVRDILEEMLGKSAFAILVMTGEDVMADGTLRARQNVVHEAGLFQGRLGFTRAIVLLEEGTEEFSNIQGVEQIRFAAGRIRETFGDILATLKREFGPSV